MKEIIFTEEEIFDIFGLFIGMMTAESRAVIHGNYKGPTPATDWYYKWAEHPSLIKARHIYNDVKTSKLSTLCSPSYAQNPPASS